MSALWCTCCEFLMAKCPAANLPLIGVQSPWNITIHNTFQLYFYVTEKCMSNNKSVFNSFTVYNSIIRIPNFITVLRTRPYTFCDFLKSLNVESTWYENIFITYVTCNCSILVLRNDLPQCYKYRIKIKNLLYHDVLENF